MLGHFAGLSRVFREYQRFTASQYAQLARLEGPTGRENRSSRASWRSGLESLYAVIRPFTTAHVQATSVIWEYTSPGEDLPFRLSGVNRSDNNIPQATRLEVVRDVLDRQKDNAGIYTQGGHREAFVLAGSRCVAYRDSIRILTSPGSNDTALVPV